MTQAQAASLRLVARVASASRPGMAYEVKTDGRTLSCSCNGWTRQVHTADCAAARGQRCTCRHSTAPKPMRTCRHLRETEAKIRAAGGLQAVLRLIERGVTLSDSDAAGLPTVPPPTGVARAVLIEEAQRVLRHGPTRVMVDAQGLAVSPESARTRHGVTPGIVFIRDDGWSLGSPAQFESRAAALYADHWIGVLRLPTQAAQSVVSYALWQAGTTPISRGRETTRSRPAPAVPADDLSWVGGGRAIILMD